MKPKIMLHEGEEILFEERPSDKYIKVLFLSRAWHLLCFAIIIVVALAYHSKDLNLSAGVGILPTVIGVIIVILLVVLAGLYYLSKAAMKRHWYFLTNQRIILYSGFISINKKYIPYSRVADVNITQNLFHRLVGLSRVRVDETMAGGFSRRGNLAGVNFVDGLTAEDADKFAHFVSQHMVTN